MKVKTTTVPVTTLKEVPVACSIRTSGGAELELRGHEKDRRTAYVECYGHHFTAKDCHEAALFFFNLGQVLSDKQQVSKIEGVPV